VGEGGGGQIEMPIAEGIDGEKPKASTRWDVGRLCPLSRKLMGFHSWKCYILLHFDALLN